MSLFHTCFIGLPHFIFIELVINQQPTKILNCSIIFDIISFSIQYSRMGNVIGEMSLMDFYQLDVPTCSSGLLVIPSTLQILNHLGHPALQHLDTTKKQIYKLKCGSFLLWIPKSIPTPTIRCMLVYIVSIKKTCKWKVERCRVEKGQRSNTECLRKLVDKLASRCINNSQNRSLSTTRSIIGQIGCKSEGKKLFYV